MADKKAQPAGFLLKGWEKLGWGRRGEVRKSKIAIKSRSIQKSFTGLEDD